MLGYHARASTGRDYHAAIGNYRLDPLGTFVYAEGACPALEFQVKHADNVIVRTALDLTQALTSFLAQIATVAAVRAAERAAA